jgi:nucleoside-diphosphate-sugar epimerase
MKGEELLITGTGEETRDFTYVEDIVDGLLRAGYYENAIGKEFNLASGIETKIGELAIMINKAVSNKAGVRFGIRRNWDTKSRLLASIEKANLLIGYKPKTGFDEGLINTVKWFRDNWNYIQNSASFSPGMSSAVREK